MRFHPGRFLNSFVVFTQTITLGFANGRQRSNTWRRRRPFERFLAAAAGEPRPLDLDSEHLASSNCLDCANRTRDERQEILKSVACTAQNDDAELPFGNVLLELKIPISCDENAEAGGFCCIEQGTVL